ncbi:uncharacterized protein LOC132741396 [Ruditapes philippinarum]|uniref:uncharacterized protein LOC132741396 n=1 Tax=Ruditapes philippinarum TaxID=129788 RepID=UPI00295B97C2|nr:uncharacterized protein LOC132741396 [Ruditapes philippinarum]
MSEQEGKNSDISLPQGNSDTGEELESELRTRKLTSKGREYQIDLKEKGFRSCLSAWRAHTNKLHVLLSDSDNMQALRTHRDILQASFDELSSVFLELQDLKEDVSEEISKFETTEINHQQLMQSIAERIREIENQQLEGRSNRSSRSNRSHLSRRSNVSHVSDTVIRKAKLKAELRYIDAELRCKAELEKIKIDKRKEVATAELDALEEIDCNSDKNDSWLNDLAPEVVKKEYVNDFVERHSSTILESKTSAVNPVVTAMPSFTVPNNTSSHQLTGTDSLTQTYLNPSVTPFVPNLNVVSNPSVGIQTSTPATINNDPDHSNEKEIANLAKVLADQVSLSRLPPPEPTIFYGDPIQFPAWKAAFNTLIDKINLPDGEKIHYLKKYLGGPVRQVVENYFLLSTEDAYDDARKLLNERYGDPFVIASAFRDKLESWPKIMPKDASGLLKFSDFMKQCLTAMNSVPSLSVLNDCRENRKLLSKLPDWLIGRWNRIAATSQEEHKVFPSFKEFVNFVSKEARIASDPVTSVFSVKGNLSSPCDRGMKLSSKENKSQGRSYLSHTQDTNRSSSSFPNISCPLCQGPHNIDVCASFLKKSVVDRKTFIKEKRLCFGCLRSGHVSKMCRKRKTCNVCSKSHPTSLHGDVKRKDSQRESASESAKSSDKVDTDKSAPKPISYSGAAFLSNVFPREVITPDGNGPYAQKTDLGWTIVGTIDSDCVENDSIGLSHHVLCHEVPSALSVSDNHKNTVMFSLRTKVKEVVSSDILRVLEHDFCDLGITGDKLSQEDKLFLSKLSENICFQNGHYEMPLPFKGKDPVLPNNKSMA